MDELIATVNRFNMILYHIGFALWQIQELESSTAHYLVLITQAKMGMGYQAGSELLDKSLGRTFGSTIHQATKAGILCKELEHRFLDLLKERNWLVHNSRRQSRNAMSSDEVAGRLIQRLKTIAEESKAILLEVGELAEKYVRGFGISQEQIEEATNNLLDQWHKS